MSLPRVGEIWTDTNRERCCLDDLGGDHRHCVACGEVCDVGGHIETGIDDVTIRACTAETLPDRHGTIATVRGPFRRGRAPWER